MTSSASRLSWGVPHRRHRPALHPRPPTLLPSICCDHRFPEPTAFPYRTSVSTRPSPLCFPHLPVLVAAVFTTAEPAAAWTHRRRHSGDQVVTRCCPLASPRAIDHRYPFCLPARALPPRARTQPSSGRRLGRCRARLRPPRDLPSIPSDACERQLSNGPSRASSRCRKRPAGDVHRSSLPLLCCRAL
jgi:hypothetical protein